MFEGISEKLNTTLKRVRGYGKLSEQNIEDALREVRLSLLEADVNFKVVRDFMPYLCAKYPKKVTELPSILHTYQDCNLQNSENELNFGRINIESHYIS